MIWSSPLAGDLPGEVVAVALPWARPDRCEFPFLPSTVIDWGQRETSYVVHRYRGACARSEEHTSELQSH